jgi:hypothetical protein
MPLTIAGVAAGIPWGAIGIATGYTVITSALAIPSVIFCLKASQLRGQDFFAAISRPTVATIVAAGLLTVIVPLMPGPDLLPLRLMFHGVMFGLLYFGLWIGIPGGIQSFREMIALIRPVGA